MRWLLAALIACLAAATAPPARASIPYSTVWTFAGTCDGTDQVTVWKIAGPGLMDSYKIGPWRDEAIRVFAFEIVQMTGGPSLYWAIGSTHIGGNMMMWVGPGGRHGYKDFPPGTGVMVVKPPHPRRYLDLHGACTGGGPVSVTLTIYYTLEAEL
jgi:hypothetical protein